MDATSSTIHTEIRGLDLCLDNLQLILLTDGDELIAPIALSPVDADRLRIEMFKAKLPEWNQLEEAKSRAEQRYRRYLGAWLVMCLAAFSAYLGYPSYYLCLFLAALSIFLWWRAGYEEQQGERASQAERSKFRAEWSYLRARLEEEVDEE